MENISCLDNVVEFILRTENFSPDDIEEGLLFDNCTGQTIGSTKFTNSDTHKNEFNDMTKAVMESAPYEDGLLYSADILSVPSFSSNHKKMDQGQQINQEPFDPTDLFEFSDEEFRQMINLQDSFDVQKVVDIKECPKQDIFIQSLDMNYFTVFDIILKTEAEYNMSSTSIVDIPIPEGEEASYSVNPYKLSRFNQKSHVINHMLTNHTKHPFSDVLCSNRYHRKSDLTKHIMKIHNGHNNVSHSSQFTVPIHSRSITNGKGFENKGDIYQEPNTKKGNGCRKSRNKKKNLLLALKLHSKPHTCNPCALSFTYKKVLLKHFRLHHNHYGVNIVSTQKSNSESYELTILDNSKFNKVPSYICDSCKAVYNRFDFFKRHNRLHIQLELRNIGEATDRCIDSGLLLNSLPELELPTKQHLIVTRFPKKSKCSVCDRQFGVTDEVSDIDRSQLHSYSLTEYVCRLCRNLSNDRKVLRKDLIIHDTSDDNVGTYKNQRHSKLSNQKNTCSLVPNAMAGQCDTDICEDKPVPTDDEPYIQSIINEDDMHSNPMSVDSPSESRAKTFKIINGKLQKNKRKSSEQVSPGSKYTVFKSEYVPKKQKFVLKDGECTRTCSTVLYYYPKSYSNVMNSPLSEESKENNCLIEAEDQKTTG